MRSKVVFFITIILAFLAVPVRAQSDNPPVPNPPSGGKSVVDQLNWLSTDQEDFINNLASQLDKNGLAVMDVVTLSNCGGDKTAYRKSILRSWNMGHAGKNDGLLILVCWHDGDKSRRSVEQEFGSGLTTVLTSTKTDQVARQRFVPAFEQNRPGDGLVAMVKDYDSILRKGPAKPSGSHIDPDLLWFFLIIGFGTAFIIYSRKRAGSSDSYSDGDYSGGGYDGGGGSDGGGSSTSF
jgi:uncharacterized protein